jgi:hypothetical protein
MKVSESKVLSNAQWAILGINVCGAFMIVVSVTSAIIFNHFGSGVKKQKLCQQLVLPLI